MTVTLNLNVMHIMGIPDSRLSFNICILAGFMHHAVLWNTYFETTIQKCRFLPLTLTSGLKNLPEVKRFRGFKNLLVDIFHLVPFLFT